MGKLYPPNIKGVIPAFYGTTIVVPFSMNRAVGRKDIQGFNLKIKTISGILKLTSSVGENCIDFENLEVTFNLHNSTNQSFEIGEFYKIQLAYIDKTGTVGHYSNVGIAKYTTKPEVYIEGLSAMDANTHIYSYLGVYSQESDSGTQKDASEKMYSSRFIIWKDYVDDEHVYRDTGEMIHNITTDISTYQSTEYFKVTEELDQNSVYFLQFQVTTVNLMKINSPLYRLKQRRSMDGEYNFKVIATNDFVNGCITIGLQEKNNRMVSGNFIVTRADEEHNFLNWSEIFDLQIEYSIDISNWSAKDFSAEQGVRYKYSIQQYNSTGLFTERQISDSVYSDFEDIFLYDGEKLLNIRYNAKISKFQIDLEEQKQDTIGSKYPFILKKGAAHYREFPIQGLFSHLSDVDGLFLDKSKMFNDKRNYVLANLQSENIYAERQFKMEALEWLSNGEPKLFKSPEEGNYIVTLMNTSLSPQDTLGRMLHNFSTTAYEVMEYNGENLYDNNLIGNMLVPIAEQVEKTVSFATLMDRIQSQDYEEDDEGYITDEEGYITFKLRGVRSFMLTGIMPKTFFKVNNTLKFMIGSTGSYYYDEGQNGIPITSLSIKVTDGNNRLKAEDVKNSYIMDYLKNFGSITYMYNKKNQSFVEDVSYLETRDVPLMQFFGDYYKNEKTVTLQGEFKDHCDDIWEFIQDIRTTISDVYMLRLMERDFEYIYIKEETWNKFIEDENIELPADYSSVKSFKQYLAKNIFDEKNNSGLVFYKDRFYTEKKSFDTLEVNKYYKIRFGYEEEDLPRDLFELEGYYIERLDDKYCKYTDYAIDGMTYEIFLLDDNAYIGEINGSKINIREVGYYTDQAPGRIDKSEIISLNIAKAVTAEISFTKVTTHYGLEEENEKIIKLKNIYLTLLENSQLLDSDYKYFLDNVESNEELNRLFPNNDIKFMEFKQSLRNLDGRVDSSRILNEVYNNYMYALIEALVEKKQAGEIV